MAPWSMTKMVSASRMVESRWAITKLVRPRSRRAMAFWMSTSVLVSTELVASSRMRICGSARKALAMVSSCFSPCEMFMEIVVEAGVVALGKCAHEVVGVSSAGGGQHLFLRGSFAAVRDVVVDSAAEEPGVLKHHAVEAPEVVAAHITDIHPIDGYAALIDLVEAKKQIHQGDLARAGRSHYGYGLTRFHFQVEVLD